MKEDSQKESQMSRKNRGLTPMDNNVTLEVRHFPRRVKPAAGVKTAPKS